MSATSIPTRRSLLALTVLAISFGYIEGAIVVYLREILYPDGFSFPLVPISGRLLRIEMVREAATIFLMIGAAWAASNEPIRRFGAFAFLFGVWDIVYYIALKLTIGWPDTILDWDILFLLPIPWAGPVLSPVLVAFAITAVGGALYLLPEGKRPSISRLDWWVEIAAGLIVLVAFMWNGLMILREGSPTHFPWTLFLIGYLGGWAWFIYRWLARSGSRS